MAGWRSRIGGRASHTANPAICGWLEIEDRGAGSLTLLTRPQEATVRGDCPSTGRQQLRLRGICDWLFYAGVICS